ncbi:HlyD family efflux transporter periplasmic adaptor subunit [Budvicia diplopodorum]|uniref:HlyD family efflux transporter periplasmic adaptor subunit n=1 Tax=Budvicia diplopodorum TaxID=1119056 RepID=UPI001358D12F|nr:HlyD family efflux transporter periplasmic adaptor subunit [Budvicia diplopodorum]
MPQKDQHDEQSDVGEVTLSLRNIATFYSIDLVTTRWVISLLLAAMMSFFLFSILFKFNESVAAKGVLISPQGDIQIKSPESGSIIDFAVIPGAKVEANGVLFWVSKDRGSIGSTSVSQFNNQTLTQEAERVKERITLLKALRAEREKRFTEQLETYQRTEQTLNKKVEQMKVLSANAQRKYLATKKLAEKDLVSRTSLDEVQSEVMTQALNEKIEQSSILELANRRSAAESEHSLSRSNIDDELFRLYNRTNEIARQLLVEGSDRVAVLAPHSGTVVAINLPQGKAIGANLETVMVVRRAESEQMHAYLYIPATGMGTIEKETEVKLRFDAFPVDKYGTVSAKLDIMHPISIDSNAMLIGDRNEKESYYLARLTIPNHFVDNLGIKHPLLGGMTLNADITIDRKPLIMLLLSPLERVRQRFF